jgi:hypothetical protein
MKRFQLLQFIVPGQVIPAWYGLAWYDWQRNGHYALPIFLALPCGVARWLWAGLRTGSKAMAIDSRVAYLDGIQQGILIARKDPSLLHRLFVVRAGNRSTIINADTYDQQGGKR